MGFKIVKGQQLIGLGLDVLCVVITAIFRLLVVVLFPSSMQRTTRPRRPRVAGLRSEEEGRTFQFILAVVLIQHYADRTERKQTRKQNMSDFMDQLPDF